MTYALSPNTPAETRQARVYAFPPARNARTVERLLGRYLDLWRAHGYADAVRIFEVRHANPIRRRLTSAGVPAQTVEQEIGALKVAMRVLYGRQTAARQGEHQA